MGSPMALGMKVSLGFNLRERDGFRLVSRALPISNVFVSVRLQFACEKYFILHSLITN